MAKRKRAHARRSRATKIARRSRATKVTRRTAEPACTHDQPAPRKRGPKPGTPSWRKFSFTPELLADCRRRYEQTGEYVTSIARDYGVDECTVRRTAKRNGWVRYRAPPRDLPPAARLRVAAEALEASTLPPRSGGEGIGGLRPPFFSVRTPMRSIGYVTLREQCEPGWGDLAGAEAPPTPNPPSLRFGGRVSKPAIASATAGDPSPPLALLVGGGEETVAPPNEAEAPTDIADTIECLHRAVLAELATVETMRARMKNTPQSPADAERTARTLSNLTDTLHKLQRMSCAIPQAADYDDMPADIDAFRIDLARRIDAFVASRTEPGHADGDAGAVPVDEVQR